MEKPMFLKRNTVLRLSNSMFLKLPKKAQIVLHRNPRRISVNGLTFFKAGDEFYVSICGEVLKVFPAKGFRFNPHPPFPLSLL